MSCHSGPYNRGIITKDLVLYYDVNEPVCYSSGRTDIQDLSRNGNTGTLVNGVGYSADNGGSLVFDGVNDYANIITSNSLNIGGLNLTLSAFIRPTALANATHGASIISRASGSNDGLYEMLLIQSNSKNYVYFRMYLIGNYVPALIPIELNTIYHISCVYDNGTMKNYINGTMEGDGNIRNINITQAVNRNVFIGTRGTIGFFPGNIYNVNVYNRALSASEIQQNFNASRSIFGL